MLGQKHQRGIGVIHWRAGILFHSLSGIRQSISSAEIQNLNPALSDEFSEKSWAFTGLGNKVHGFGDDGAGREKLSRKGVESSHDLGMFFLRRDEVGNQRPGVKKPGSQDRQLRSRISRCQESELSGGRSSCPRRCPVRDDKGRSSRASLKISRATSETVLPWTSARCWSAERSLSSVLIVNVARMNAVYYKDPDGAGGGGPVSFFGPIPG